MLNLLASKKKKSLVASFTALCLALTLSSCSSDSSDTASSGAAGEVSDGGTLRLATLGSPEETLDFTQAVTYLPLTVGFNIFDSIAMLKGGEMVLQLAESVEPNADATEWTIKIHEGVTFHDGTPLTADDVLYSLKYIAESPNYQLSYSAVDWAASNSDGDRTVNLVMNRSAADFVETGLGSVSMVFPEGTVTEDFSEQIGSGPFKLESFSSDTGAVLARNEDYWDGTPALERVEIQSIVDPAARAKALNSGQIDYAHKLSATDASTLSGNLELIDWGVENSDGFMIKMNTNIAPFDDPEVTEAFRLAIDREQMVETIFRGEGEIGNDLFSKGLPGYAGSIEQREQDQDKARQILEEKGVTEATVLGAELTPGIMDSLRLYQQQLAEVGVELEIEEADPSTVLADPARLRETSMFSMYFVNRPAMPALLWYISEGGPLNFFVWDNDETSALITQAQETTDDAQRQEILDELQQILWERGGDIIWGYQSNLDGSVSNLTGVELSQGAPLLAKAGYVD